MSPLIGDELLVTELLNDRLHELLGLEPVLVPQHLSRVIRATIGLQDVWEREHNETEVRGFTIATPGANSGIVQNTVVTTDTYLLAVHVEAVGPQVNMDRNPALWLTPPPAIGVARSLLQLWDHTSANVLATTTVGGAATFVYQPQLTVKIGGFPIWLQAGTNLDFALHSGAGGAATVTLAYYLSTARGGVRIAR